MLANVSERRQEIGTRLAIALGLAVACGAGIALGLWPAYQAAKVNPIEAPRAG